MTQNADYERVMDQGCEFCDHMVTDTLDMPDDREFHGQLAHFWVCGECWNRHWREHREASPNDRSEP